MESNFVRKILSFIDVSTNLIVILFGTAGLLLAIQPAKGTSDNNTPQDSSAQCERLTTEVAAKAAEAQKLESALAGSDPLDLAALQTLLQAAGRKQEKVGEIERTVAELRGKLDSAEGVLVDRHNVVVLQTRIAERQAEWERLEQRRKELAGKITDEDRERARTQELQKKREDLEAEMKRLESMIAELQQSTPPPGPPGSSAWPGGSYHGPYVLVECDAKGAMVYPGRKRILTGSLAAETAWLQGQVRRAGAAFLVVRPDSFKTSYPKFHTLLTELADKETTQGKAIVLSFWPIEADESIQSYLPKDN
jgi:cell division protein FtsB